METLRAVRCALLHTSRMGLCTTEGEPQDKLPVAACTCGKCDCLRVGLKEGPLMCSQDDAHCTCMYHSAAGHNLFSDRLTVLSCVLQVGLKEGALVCPQKSLSPQRPLIYTEALFSPINLLHLCVCRWG